jgi:hypothetical protein
MKFIEIELDGRTVRAKLNEKKAPKTVEAIWNALPFSGTAIHAQVSGDMFRMLEPAPCGEVEVESAELFQSPGQIVYYPPINEIAFCVGNAQFAGTHGPYWCTPLGDLDGDWREWGEYGNQLNSHGAKAIHFRAAEDQISPFTIARDEAGDNIEFVFGGSVVAHGHLLEKSSPRTVAALKERLPFEGVAVNATWAGPMTEVRPGGGSSGVLDLGDVSDPGTIFHWEGYVYYSPMRKLIVISYGSAQDGAAGHPVELVPVARITSGLDEYIAVAVAQRDEGAKPLIVRAA